MNMARNNLLLMLGCNSHTSVTMFQFYPLIIPARTELRTSWIPVTNTGRCRHRRRFINHHIRSPPGPLITIHHTSTRDTASIARIRIQRSHESCGALRRRPIPDSHVRRRGSWIRRAILRGNILGRVTRGSLSGRCALAGEILLTHDEYRVRCIDFENNRMEGCLEETGLGYGDGSTGKFHDSRRWTRPKRGWQQHVTPAVINIGRVLLLVTPSSLL